jgi:hypothetical protein
VLPVFHAGTGEKNYECGYIWIDICAIPRGDRIRDVLQHFKRFVALEELGSSNLSMEEMEGRLS